MSGGYNAGHPAAKWDASAIKNKSACPGGEMNRFCLWALLVACFNLPLLSQTDKAELFGGYSLERIAPGCGNDYTCGSINDVGQTANFNGWAASMTGYFYRSLGITAQVTGGYNGNIVPAYSGVHRYAYQFGPTYAIRWQHASAFAHGLFGGVSQGGPDQGYGLGYNRFLWSLGGGLDIKVSRSLSVRAAQIDYERQSVPVQSASGLLNATYPSNGLRYSAGVVVRF
jgi:hypothetical protein